MAVRARYRTQVAMKARIALATIALLGACSSSPPAPDWQGNAKSATERAVAAYLVGNARVEAAELARARSELRDRKSTRLNSSHIQKSRMPSSA